MDIKASKWHRDDNSRYARGYEIMRYLIDTNVFLFYVRESDRLSKEVSELLWDTSNTINISSRSIEEITQRPCGPRYNGTRHNQQNNTHKLGQ